MEDKHKQRIVGAMVLVALAIIFLPGLFYREEVVEVSIPAPIPTPPPVEKVVVAPPVKPATQLRTEKAFVPETTQPEQRSQRPEKPRLTNQGVPEGWLVQVASLKLQKSAETLVLRLKEDKHKAYWQKASTSQGDLYRVFVGPLIDKGRAQAAKKQIDREQKVSSIIQRFNPASGK